MPSTLGFLSKTIQSAPGISSAPRKHSKKSKKEATVPVTVADKGNPRKAPRKNAPPRRGLPPNNESDDEDPASLLASFQQGRLGDSVQAEGLRYQLTEDSKPSSQVSRPQSQPQTDQDTVDTSSSPLPHRKRKGGRRPEAGSRCDTCIIQRRRCDGGKPVCGRCISLSKDCEWHEEPISRTELEELRHKEALEGAMTKPRKRVHDELDGRYAVESRPVSAASQSGENITERRAHRARLDDQIANLKAGEDALRPARQRPAPVSDQGDRPTIMDAEASERGTDRWTYEDHLEMLDSLSEPRVDPITKEQVLGHKKGNKIFDDTTKAFEDFGNLEDLDEGVPPMHKYDCLKLNWEESEDISRIMPKAALRTGGQWLPSNLRERIGLPAYPVPSVEVPLVQERTAGVRMQIQSRQGHHMPLAGTGRDDLNDWMEEPRKHAEDWDNGVRLPRPDEVADFSWYAAD